MKKWGYVVISLTVLMSACNSGKKKQPVPRQPEVAVEVNKPEQSAPDMHNARNSLDYKGTYTGTLPAADGMGVEVTVVLSDSTYRKTVVYIDQDVKPYITEGRYAWDDRGTVITLLSDEKPNQYKVAENRLIHLDTEGKEIRSFSRILINGG